MRRSLATLADACRTWLSPVEKLLVARRSATEGHPSVEPHLWQSIKAALRTKKIYLFAATMVLNHLGTSWTNYMPTLTAALIENRVTSLLLLCPPYRAPTTIGLC